MPTKNHQQLLIILALAMVALFAADKLVLTPLSNAWDARAGRLKALRTQLSRGKMLVQRERGIRSHWDEMRSRTLTNNTSAADQQVFHAINSWADSSGVIIGAITPQVKSDSDDYATYNCRVDAKGDIRQISHFLYAAEREPLALRIDSVELNAVDKGGQQLSLGLQFSGLILHPLPQ